MPVVGSRTTISPSSMILRVFPLDGQQYYSYDLLVYGFVKAFVYERRQGRFGLRSIEAVQILYESIEHGNRGVLDEISVTV